MDSEALVDRDIEEGRRLIHALDQAGFPVVAALWRFLSEESEWRLFIASPVVHKRGPLAAYKVIRDVLLESHTRLPLHHISAVDHDDPLILQFRLFAATDPAPFLGNASFRKTVIGNAYIEGAYVYRAERILGTSGTFHLWSAIRDKARKVWMARHCQITVEDSLVKKIEVEGLNLPQRQTKSGLNARLRVVTNPEERDGQLRSIEVVARGARIEGYSATASAHAGSE
jgi:hypothetical protein